MEFWVNCVSCDSYKGTADNRWYNGGTFVVPYCLTGFISNTVLWLKLLYNQHSDIHSFDFFDASWPKGRNWNNVEYILYWLFTYLKLDCTQLIIQNSGFVRSEYEWQSSLLFHNYLREIIAVQQFVLSFDIDYKNTM